MKYKRHLFILALSIVICSCMVVYAMQLAAAQKRMQAKITAKINVLLEQQQELLQRLSKQLLESIEQQNFVAISRQLRTYEDQIFVLAKQGLTLPIKIQWVSLDVPQIIINSEGQAAVAQLLAPDEKYYLRIIADPMHLQSSVNYIKDVMPEYALLNLGLGVIDGQNNMQGLLDISLSLTTLHAYLANDLDAEAKFFDFKLPNLTQPEIIFRPNVWLAGMLKFTAIILAIFCGLWFLILYMLKIYTDAQAHKLTLKHASQQIDSLTSNVNMFRTANLTQMKYGLLAADPDLPAMQLIYIPDLLADICAVNAELAQHRFVTINLPPPQALQLYMLGNHLRLMQILSGILYEIISQLPANSTVSLQLQISDLQNNVRKFNFKFMDDGFYNSLPVRGELSSTADVRVKGWDNIQRLIELVGGSFEHVHTAYSGNTICFALNVKEANNVVSIEDYLEA